MNVGVILRSTVLGTAFGFLLSRIGFTTWDDVHGMFVFADLRLFLAFCTAVALLFVVFRIAESRGIALLRRPIHKGSAIGGLLFGVGWALTGGCPGIALAQFGEGQLVAGFSIVGMFAGNYIYSVVHERYFRWSTGNCIDD